MLPFRRSILLGRGAVASGSSLLLDTYTGAVAAYSLRKLRTAYSGSAIRVRRSSDNSEQDIGFSGNDLDTASMETFCTSTDGFVVTWYDQSDSGIGNATQSTTTLQAQIVSSGSTITLNTKPAVQFDGSNDKYDIATVTVGDLVGSSYENTFLAVFRQDAAGTNNTLFARYVSGSENYFIGATTGDVIDYRFGADTGRRFQEAQPAGWDDAQHLLLLQATSSTVEVRSDGTQLDTGSPSGTPTKTTSGTARLSTFNGTQFPFDGLVQEVIIWPSSTHSPSALESAVNAFYGVY